MSAISANDVKAVLIKLMCEGIVFGSRAVAEYYSAKEERLQQSYVHRLRELADEGTDSRRTHVATRRHWVIFPSAINDDPPPTMWPLVLQKNNWSNVLSLT